MLVDSEALVQRAYDSANGEAFAIPMTDRWIVFVSDRDQVKRLENEPESVLSMEEALHEVWSPSLVRHMDGGTETLLKHNSLHLQNQFWAIIKSHPSTRVPRASHFASRLAC